MKIKGVEIYSDLDDYRSPSIITGELLRPDLLIISKGGVVCFRAYCRFRDQSV